MSNQNLKKTKKNCLQMGWTWFNHNEQSENHSASYGSTLTFQ